jgi:hypothetical protein
MWFKIIEYVRQQICQTLKNLNTCQQILTVIQLPRKLAASASQALFKCLMSKSVSSLNDGGSTSICIHVTLFFTTELKRTLHKMALANMLWALLLSPALDKYHCHSSLIILYYAASECCKRLGNTGLHSIFISSLLIMNVEMCGQQCYSA